MNFLHSRNCPCMLSGQSTSYREASYREIYLRNGELNDAETSMLLDAFLDFHLDVTGGLLRRREWDGNWSDASAKSGAKCYECQSKFSGCRRTGHRSNNYRKRLYIVFGCEPQ